MIAALFVATGGIYFGRDGVDAWDVARDARTYAGPHAVVAHPPCERWGRYWYGGPMLHKLGRRKTLGDDAGCFAAALASVRRWGGVLEHPEASHAWRRFGISAPPHQGGWVAAGDGVGWTCCVEQGHYGHRARKKTWLYAAHVELPTLTWGPSESRVRIDDGFHSSEERRRRQRLGVMSGGPANGFLERMGKRERAATPSPFAELLLSIARTAHQRSEVA